MDSKPEGYGRPIRHWGAGLIPHYCLVIHSLRRLRNSLPANKGKHDA